MTEVMAISVMSRLLVEPPVGVPPRRRGLEGAVEAELHLTAVSVMAQRDVHQTAISVMARSDIHLTAISVMADQTNQRWPATAMACRAAPDGDISRNRIDWRWLYR